MGAIFASTVGFCRRVLAAEGGVFADFDLLRYRCRFVGGDGLCQMAIVGDVSRSGRRAKRQDGRINGLRGMGQRGVTFLVQGLVR